MKDLSPVQGMLEKYHCRNNEERRNALKEIVQEISLLALNRSGFFNLAAFYGGTALRIFHKLDRFSEDLDFSLIEKNPDFDLEAYLPAIRDELGSYGFEIEVEKKIKVVNTAIQSAFIKGNTLVHLVKIGSVDPAVPGIPRNEQLKIKIEIDIDPPAGARYEVKYGLTPIPYAVRLFDLPSLFAGKIHALLYRNWKSRVKGRDFYDYVWYLSSGIPVNLPHLEARMRQSGNRKTENILTHKELIKLLEDRFSRIDYEQVKSDALPFVRDTASLDLWSQNFFIAISRDRLQV
ncbi:hypothetical protein AGMMS50293_23180 [Spirochaetia bacterium]|nr:hypothetical protein AGMMS50293_23180 [Spirochaetia bacterium]